MRVCVRRERSVVQSPSVAHFALAFVVVTQVQGVERNKAQEAGLHHHTSSFKSIHPPKRRLCCHEHFSDLSRNVIKWSTLDIQVSMRLEKLDRPPVQI